MTDNPDITTLLPDGEEGKQSWAPSLRSNPKSTCETTRRRNQY